MLTNSIIIKSLLLILLSCDRKIKRMLDYFCWFNSVNDLAENDIAEQECMDMQMAREWCGLRQRGYRRERTSTLSSSCSFWPAFPAGAAVPSQT